MLSGGQIQRIGIARAVYHKSEILIFDESTNSLDVDSEQKIIDAIVSLKDKKTIIMISHKMSVLKICNKIYKIKDKKLELKNE
jgi:ABC-type bacteriocin/lantibiotic exporter with double-glycine peptidase domain